MPGVFASEPPRTSVTVDTARCAPTVTVTRTRAPGRFLPRIEPFGTVNRAGQQAWPKRLRPPRCPFFQRADAPDSVITARRSSSGVNLPDRRGLLALTYRPKLRAVEPLAPTEYATGCATMRRGVLAVAGSGMRVVNAIPTVIATARTSVTS